MHLKRFGWPKSRNRRVVGYAEPTDEHVGSKKVMIELVINVFARLKYSLVHGSNALSTLSDAPVPPTAGVLQKPPKPKWEPFICGGFHIPAGENPPSHPVWNSRQSSQISITLPKLFRMSDIVPLGSQSLQPSISKRHSTATEIYAL